MKFHKGNQICFLIMRVEKRHEKYVSVSSQTLIYKPQYADLEQQVTVDDNKSLSAYPLTSSVA